MPYPPQRRADRHQKKKSATRRAIVVLIVLALVFAGIGYFYYTARSVARPLDPATFCPTDHQGPKSVTAILIDGTDTFNLTQETAIRDHLNAIKDTTSQFDLIEIYAVGSTQQKLLQPEFSMCNPGRGEDISKWTGNPHLIEERWQLFFAEPLQHLFDSILGGGEAQISPIMEDIQSIVVTRLGAENLVLKKTPRKLIIISDLLQYVKDYSQYKPLARFDQFRTTPYYQSVRSDLSGISIEIWYVRRQSTLQLQGEKHVDFWRNYFADQGGTVDKVWYVPGL